MSLPDRKRILFVDDDDDTREMDQELFELLGHECVTAGSGGEALAALDHFDPHVIFLDIGLPDMSGQELARAIRARLGDEIPIIAVSARSQPADVQRSMDSGIDLHLPKPIGVETFRRLVGDAKQRSSRAHERTTRENPRRAPPGSARPRARMARGR
jgi:CheY-like chemotaxis protein